MSQKNKNLDKLQNILRGPVKGPSAWYGARIKNSDEWIVTLSSGDVVEIEHAIQASRSLDIKDISQSDFYLPKFGLKLSKNMVIVLKNNFAPKAFLFEFSTLIFSFRTL